MSTQAHTPIQPGQFFVHNGPWSTSCYEAIKVMDKTVIYVDRGWGARERRMSRDNIVFAGSEETARRLTEQLQSSRAQCTADKQAAYQRQIKRDAELVERAKAEGR